MLSAWPRGRYAGSISVYAGRAAGRSCATGGSGASGLMIECSGSPASRLSEDGEHVKCLLVREIGASCRAGEIDHRESEGRLALIFCEHTRLAHPTWVLGDETIYHRMLIASDASRRRDRVTRALAL